MNKTQKKYVSVNDMFGAKRTPVGRAAFHRAMERAAKEQADLLKKAAALERK